jgi:hypothetical protein
MLPVPINMQEKSIDPVIAPEIDMEFRVSSIIVTDSPGYMVPAGMSFDVVAPGSASATYVCAVLAADTAICPAGAPSGYDHCIVKSDPTGAFCPALEGFITVIFLGIVVVAEAEPWELLILNDTVASEAKSNEA